MNLAHKIRLDPTDAQLTYFRKAAGTRRKVWNEGLHAWNKQYEIASTAASLAYAKAEADDLSQSDTKSAVKEAVIEVGGWPSGNSIMKVFNKTKYDKFPWLENIHRDAHSRPFIDLQDAFNRQRSGAGKPKFKRKGKSRDSFYVSNDRIKLEGKRVKLPVIGWIRMEEELRFTGKVMSATVSRTADRWYVSISVETDNPRPAKVNKKTGELLTSSKPLPESDRNFVVGVDLGLTHLATLSTGESIEAPKPLKKALKRLARLQRAQARKFEVGRKSQQENLRYRSQNWLKGNVKLQRLHASVANIRKDFTHKLTTRLCRENQTVVIEDLNVSGMMRNRKLARSIADVGWYELRMQLEYKKDIYGTRIIVANQFYPSSKLCFVCGAKKTVLLLKEREFSCPCGWTSDRDRNAALNLEKLWNPGLLGDSLRTGQTLDLDETGTRCALVRTH